MTSCALLFHDVVVGTDFSASGFRGADADIYKLTLPGFQALLDVIAAEGARPVVCGQRALPPAGNDVMLTFDDGGAGALVTADELERRGWRGHFFFPTAFIGQPGFMSAAGVRDLHARGHVVGSHSHSHPIPITALPAPQLADEWLRSASILEDLLGARIDTGSIPAGFYSTRVAEAAAAAGISTLFTSEPRRTAWQAGGIRMLGRYSVMRHTSTRHLQHTLRGAPLALFGASLAWGSKKVVKRVGGGAWLAFRRRILARFVSGVTA